ncbi:Calmodulin, putative [Perkinsus marinus ATCC 50983]|uniref:Calmodulin, putative n=1 Tax=Perkinsus marinus (strain ATCC 50983 / TXsc) TaxID=423536 RepID=C5LZM2_PERM5|nr:Calmodulin, putative [Perkinsus marinus ATCC 50983]EEQ97820.1 Calmodulin, putative [Perkinsus marinus ATCC 50983]|eukprot:XP_002765103.1 Calmodulin, putative [Perkinsus marinus ATCC 50983]
MSRRTNDDYPPEEVESAFKALAATDAADGTISINDLHRALTSYGEGRLSEIEAKDLCSNLDHIDGHFNYRDYINMTMNR